MVPSNWVNMQLNHGYIHILLGKAAHLEYFRNRASFDKARCSRTITHVPPLWQGKLLQHNVTRVISKISVWCHGGHCFLILFVINAWHQSRYCTGRGGSFLEIIKRKAFTVTHCYWRSKASRLLGYETTWTELQSPTFWRNFSRSPEHEGSRFIPIVGTFITDYPMSFSKSLSASYMA